MKKQLITFILGAFLSSFAFAGDTVNSVNVKGSGASMEEGFQTWAHEVTTMGGPGGQVLAEEVKAWVAEAKKISE